jgi:LacI family transcriptional regulator
MVSFASTRIYRFKVPADMHHNPCKITLRQVACSANVSLKTASRVLNHEPHVAPEKEAAVLAAIKRLDYHPNQLARGLKARRSGVIGVVVTFLSHNFMAGCIQAIHHAAEKAGFTIMVTVSNGNPEMEATQIRTLQQHQVEGLIIFPTASNLLKESAAELTGTPVVIVDQPTLAQEMDSIVVANQDTAQTVVNHLIGHGYSKIAVIGANRCLNTISERIAGYQKAMRAAGLSTIELVPASEDRLSVAAICKLFDSPSTRPRAVFTLNSAASIKALQAIKQSHLRIPDDVALFGFDDFDTAESLQPTISVVSQPIEQIGKAAVELFFKRRRQTRKQPAQKLVLVPRIMIRASCGCDCSTSQSVTK